MNEVRGKAIFILGNVCLSTFKGGGWVPSFPMGGVPPSFLTEGTPSFLMVDTSVLPDGRGLPTSFLMGGTPSFPMGVSHPRSGWGVPPFQVRTGGTPIPGHIPPSCGTPITRMGYLYPDLGWGYLLLAGRGYPPVQVPGQDGVYLLRDGRYASCLHTGGLSCSNVIFLPKILVTIVCH